MTDKQIIKLRPMEDLNEKIIKEKGNTKCIFYSDDECRNGDRTRDCINCARVKYHSLYSLNWDNQERLQKIIKHKERECEELTSKCSQLEEFPRKIRNIISKFAQGDILTFPDLSLEKNCMAIQNQCLDPMRQIIQKLDEIQDENCHFDKIKEITKEL